MTGIIFAAGIGSRLKPFTDFHPKALAPVGGVPNVVNVARKLLTAGAGTLIVNIHHFPEQIVECLSQTEFADKVIFSDESERLLDTGGALAKIAREHPEALRDDVMVHNADIYTDFDIRLMVDAHRKAGADATVLVDPHRDSSRYFLFDSEKRLHGWTNVAKGIVKPATLDTEGLTKAAFGGVHVISPRFMRMLGETPPGVPFSITDTYIDKCGGDYISGFTPARKYRWHDIGTTEKLAAANADVAKA